MTSGTDSTEYSKRTAIRISKSTWKGIKEAAKDWQTTPANVVRRSLQAGLRKIYGITTKVKESDA